MYNMCVYSKFNIIINEELLTYVPTYIQTAVKFPLQILMKLHVDQSLVWLQRYAAYAGY